MCRVGSPCTLSGVLRLTLALTLAAVTLLSACGAGKPVPDVVGIQLDSAYDMLESASFDNFEAEYAFEERADLLGLQLGSCRAATETQRGSRY